MIRTRVELEYGKARCEIARPGSPTAEVNFLGLEGSLKREEKRSPSKRSILVYFAVVSADLRTPRRLWEEDKI